MWTLIRGATVRDLVQAKLELVGLGPFAEHLPGEISGGMKKRAGIARAMMLEPQLLFFDDRRPDSTRSLRSSSMNSLSRSAATSASLSSL
jgi:ABC-type transporter Mla maintaining outer membrane lipid asymmetry ATPase subunit MlaF